MRFRKSPARWSGKCPFVRHTARGFADPGQLTEWPRTRPASAGSARYSRTRWGRMYRLAVRRRSDGTVAVLAWTLSSFVFGIYRLYNVIRELSIRSERFTTLEFEGHSSVGVNGHCVNDCQPELFVKLGNGI